MKILWLLWVLTPSTGWFVFEAYDHKEACIEAKQGYMDLGEQMNRGEGFDYSCRPSIGAGSVWEPDSKPERFTY